MFSLFDGAINHFVKDHAIAIMATVDEGGQPSTSTIFYALTKKDEIHFITKSQTQKSKNLKQNDKAALTIAKLEGPVAVNMIGHAVEVSDTDERDEVMKKIMKISQEQLHDHAPIIKLHKGGFIVFRFVPTQAKMTDFSKHVGEVSESTRQYT